MRPLSSKDPEESRFKNYSIGRSLIWRTLFKGDTLSFNPAAQHAYHINGAVQPERDCKLDTSWLIWEELRWDPDVIHAAMPTGLVRGQTSWFNRASRPRSQFRAETGSAPTRRLQLFVRYRLDPKYGARFTFYPPQGRPRAILPFVFERRRYGLAEVPQLSE